MVSIIQKVSIEGGFEDSVTELLRYYEDYAVVLEKIPQVSPKIGAIWGQRLV